MKEVWKIIDGFENYEVSNTGRVRSLRYNKKKIIKESSDSRGYKFVKLYGPNGRKSLKTHRLVAMAFLPNPRNKEYVTHKDSDYWNNVVSNLQWVSNIERVEKAKTLGAFNRIRQDRKPGVELTVFDLYQIVKLLKSSEETHDQIALRFNVSTDTISRIKNNKVQKWATWRNILGI